MAQEKNNQLFSFETIVNLCKRRGFFYPTADIYGGINGLYDKGHLGVLFSRNIQKAWLWHMYSSEYSMIEFDGSILGNETMWKASGHVEGFHDPLIECLTCRSRFRTDDINVQKNCMKCGAMTWSDIKQFNMMFATHLGPVVDSSTVGYLRPETAQSIFVQFKNIMSTYRVKIPFGVMQIGKAFRNEITPRQFLFRTREFNQMEMEFFCHPKKADNMFLYWKNRRKSFYNLLGFNDEQVRFNDHRKEDLSHYSKATTDVEFLFPFGWKELEGIANRTNFDLTQHTSHSGKELVSYDVNAEENYVPHVVECSVGLERLMFACLCAAYHEETVNDDKRIVLKLPPFLAPLVCAVFPMSDYEHDYSYAIYKQLSSLFITSYDTTGSIGKRYRRYDEVGTPWCITVDNQSLQDGTMTLRDRDTMQQKRLTLGEIITTIAQSLMLIEKK